MTLNELIRKSGLENHWDAFGCGIKQDTPHMPRAILESIRASFVPRGTSATQVKRALAELYDKRSMLNAAIWSLEATGKTNTEK